MRRPLLRIDLTPRLEWCYRPPLKDDQKLSDFEISLSVRIFETYHKDELMEIFSHIVCDELDELTLWFTGVDTIVDYEFFRGHLFSRFKKIRHLKLVPSHFHEDMDILEWIPCWNTVESFEKTIVRVSVSCDFKVYSSNENLKAVTLNITAYDNDPLKIKPYFSPSVTAITIHGSISYSKELIEILGNLERITCLRLVGLLASIDDKDALNALLRKHRCSLKELELNMEGEYDLSPLLSLNFLMLRYTFNRSHLNDLLMHTVELRQIHSAFHTPTVLNMIRESGNGSVTIVNGKPVIRNVCAHQRCKESSLMLFLAAYRKARFPKEMAKMMTQFLLNTRCDVEAWGQKERETKRIKI